MTRDEAVAILVARLGGRADLDSGGQIVTELKQAQQQLEKGDAKREDLPWFLLSDIYTSADDLTNDATLLDTIDLPSNFLREYSAGTLWQYDSTEDNPWTNQLKKVASVEDLYSARDQYNSDVNGDPLAYTVLGDRIILGPRYPATAKTFRWTYFKKDTVLTTDVTNGWLTNAAEVLINAAGRVLAGFYLQDQEIAGVFNGAYETAAEQMWNENTERLQANLSMQMNYSPRK